MGGWCLGCIARGSVFAVQSPNCSTAAGSAVLGQEQVLP